MGLRHDALLYGSESEFVDGLLPFVRDGLAEGDGVLAVTTEANMASLERALGPQAPQVSFIDADDWYRHPARTIAGYREAVDKRKSSGTRRLRVIGEVQFGDSEPQQCEWVRYESALNHAFAGDEAWIVCPYDVRALPSWVVDQARRTHPHLRQRGRRLPSAQYTAPEKLLGRLSPMLRAGGAPLAEWRVDGELASIRSGLRDVAASAGMRGEALDHLTIAVNEVVTNALTHGAQPVHVRVHREPWMLLCEVEDAGGAVVDPREGYGPPPATEEQVDGMGLWVARQLCDLVTVDCDGRQTLVRLAKRLDGS